MPGDGPNVVLIVADGLRPDCLGIAGNPDVRTPNLDALGQYGVQFRAATMPADADISGLLMGGSPPTLPQQFHNAGYACFAAGKTADLGAAFDHTATVASDYAAMLAARGKTEQSTRWFSGDTADRPALYAKSFGAVRSNLDDALHVTSWIGDQALRFMRAPGAPFFLYVRFTRPAPPFDPPAPWDRIYDRAALHLPEGFAPDAGAGLTEARFRKVLAHYYANITLVDLQIGRILATLTARGQTNNLLVVSSSPGDPLDPAALTGRSARGGADVPARVPLLIAGLPGQLRGKTDDEAVSLAEIAPALVSCIGQAAADTREQGLLARLCPAP